MDNNLDFWEALKNEHIVTLGSSPKNIIAVIHDPDSNQIYITCHLQSPKSFWKRFINSIGYVTKAYRPRGGEYDHFLIEKTDIPLFRSFLRKVEEP